jgi:hypothetical protein
MRKFHHRRIDCGSDEQESVADDHRIPSAMHADRQIMFVDVLAAVQR